MSSAVTDKGVGFPRAHAAHGSSAMQRLCPSQLARGTGLLALLSACFGDLGVLWVFLFCF